MTTTATPYTLEDAVALNAEHPDTFKIPDAHQIEAIRPGDLVKLTFLGEDPETGCTAERMWVEVTTAGTGRYTGTLANDPSYLPLEHGELIEFTSANILDVHRGQG